jgi:hypothetical protein
VGCEPDAELGRPVRFELHIGTDTDIQRPNNPLLTIARISAVKRAKFSYDVKPRGQVPGTDRDELQKTFGRFTPKRPPSQLLLRSVPCCFLVVFALVVLNGTRINREAGQSDDPDRAHDEEATNRPM